MNLALEILHSTVAALGSTVQALSFIVQALKNEPLTVYGDGNQTRSFCYVSDLIDGILRLLMMPDRADESIADNDIHSPMNIGNPDEFTVIELARTVLELTRSSSKIEHLPLPVDDPRVRQPDISRARRMLNWEPKVKLEDGLKRTIDFLATNL